MVVRKVKFPINGDIVPRIELNPLDLFDFILIFEKKRKNQ